MILQEKVRSGSQSLNKGANNQKRVSHLGEAKSGEEAKSKVQQHGRPDSSGRIRWLMILLEGAKPVAGSPVFRSEGWNPDDQCSPAPCGQLSSWGASS